jgi:alpha-mannosidase
VYVDANATHQEVQEIARHELSGSLKVLARHINTTAGGRGIPVVVFNPLSWERTDIVEVSLPESDAGSYAVYDMHGKNVRSQSVKGDRYSHTLLFVAENIPPIGYKVYELREERATRTSGAGVKDSALAVSTAGLENEFFRVTVDPKSGWIQSIVDKRNGKEVLAGFGNELQLLEDRPSAWDAWNVGLTGVRYPSTFRGASVAEHGTVRVVLRLSADYLKPGVKKDFPTEDFPSTFFTQDIILYSGIDRIDFKTDVDWWEEKTMLKVAFPVSIEDSVATYEIPFGTIGRSTRMRSSWEKGKVEVPALRWADLSSDEYGISLLNNAKYGYDIKGNVMRLSLLRSPKWPDPTADRGKHTIHYALYPHRGRWRNAQTVRRGYEYNNPLIGVVTDRHRGILPPEHTFVKLEPSNLVLTSIKKAEDSDAWVFQWYDARGEVSSATLQLPRVPARVVKSNFLEEDLSEVPFKDHVVVVSTGRNAVMTLKVYF